MLMTSVSTTARVLAIQGLFFFYFLFFCFFCFKIKEPKDKIVAGAPNSYERIPALDVDALEANHMTLVDYIQAKTKTKTEKSRPL
jgi:hypothetical protein